MLKKENKLPLLLILGLCITWLGNFEAETKILVEPNYGYPGFAQHAYSENRAKRESDTSETDQYIDEDQSGQYTNDDQQNEFINDDQSTQNITDQHGQVNKDQSGQNTNDDQQDEFTDDDLSGQNTNNTQTYKLSHDRQGKNIPDEGAYLPDEDFEFPKTEKQTYWNFYPSSKIPPKPDSQNDTEDEKKKEEEGEEEEGKEYAAHCFWDDKRALPAEQFAVGAGKLYRPWFDAHETYSQTSDVGNYLRVVGSCVSAIHIPSRYRGSLTNFQNDIALVKLSLSLTASPAVLPACVSFDESLDEQQLSNGTAGTVMGWGLTQQDGGPSQVLNYVELPPIPVDECFEQAGSEFFKYITSDKICAGVAGQGLCTGDSGGGLVFLDGSSPPVPYLRGVASTAPKNEHGHACNTATFVAFTHVFQHRVFLLKHLPGLHRDCQRRYEAAIVEDKNSCRRPMLAGTIYSPYYGTTAHCVCYTT